MSKIVDDDFKETCEKSIVKCPEPWGLICFIVDICLPGIGTIISAYLDKEFNVWACIFGFC